MDLLNYKACFKCGIGKSYSEFYKHKQMGDGYLGKCKTCCKIDAKNNRKDNREYYSNYDKKRFKEDPRVKARHGRYLKTEEGRISSLKSKHKWRRNNPIKSRAHSSLSKSIKAGDTIRKKTCHDCDLKCKTHGHHYDYLIPLDVVWLCPKCHTSVHKDLLNLNLDIMNPEDKYLILKYREERHG